MDYAIRTEFQARGSPHAHTLIWILTYFNNTGIRHIVENMVLVHSIFLSHLLLASEPDNNSSKYIKMAKNILMKVYECLERDSTLPLDIILNTSMDSYIKALKNSSKGTNVTLKENHVNLKGNPYNHDLMKAWQANMDIQFIIDAYAV